jgi:hypothetical protein
VAVEKLVKEMKSGLYGKAMVQAALADVVLADKLPPA